MHYDIVICPLYEIYIGIKRSDRELNWRSLHVIVRKKSFRVMSMI